MGASGGMFSGGGAGRGMKGGGGLSGRMGMGGAGAMSPQMNMMANMMEDRDDAMMMALSSVDGRVSDQSRACMPPMEPPMTAWKCSTPRYCASRRCTSTKSCMSIWGKSRPQRFPVVEDRQVRVVVAFGP